MTHKEIITLALVKTAKDKTPGGRVLPMKGVSPFVSDYLGAASRLRRVGAAEEMAKSMGEDPSFNIKYPILTELLTQGGGALGGALLGHTIADTRNDGEGSTLGATVLGGLLGYGAGNLLPKWLRRKEMKGIRSKYDEIEDVDPEKPKPIPWSLSRLLPVTGYQELGRQRAYRSLVDGVDSRNSGEDAILNVMSDFIGRYNPKLGYRNNIIARNM